MMFLQLKVDCVVNNRPTNVLYIKYIKINFLVIIIKFEIKQSKLVALIDK